jgi:hypothetical protein
MIADDYTAVEQELAVDEIARDAGIDLMWAVLQGGPEGIPEASRIQVVGPVDDKIKIVHYGGYEHFERTGMLDESGAYPQIVFHWTARTEIAE